MNLGFPSMDLVECNIGSRWLVYCLVIAKKENIHHCNVTVYVLSLRPKISV